MPSRHHVQLNMAVISVRHHQRTLKGRQHPVLWVALIYMAAPLTVNCHPPLFYMTAPVQDALQDKRPSLEGSTSCSSTIRNASQHLTSHEQQLASIGPAHPVNTLHTWSSAWHATRAIFLPCRQTLQPGTTIPRALNSRNNASSSRQPHTAGGHCQGPDSLKTCWHPKAPSVHSCVRTAAMKCGTDSEPVC